MLRAIVLAAALLAAQQNALAHAVRHAGGAHSQSQEQDPETYQISGFAPSGGEVGPLRRGFSLADGPPAVRFL